MQWDDSVNAGFTAGKPWIEINPNHRQINAAAALADANSVLHHFRRVIELRHSEPVVAHGDFLMLLPDDEQIYAFLRRLDDVELLVAANFSDQPVDATAIPEANSWITSDLLLGNYTPEPADPAELTLRPWEARVYKRTQ
jgi:oligo-1,6-glucosidase